MICTGRRIRRPDGARHPLHRALQRRSGATPTHPRFPPAKGSGPRSADHTFDSCADHHRCVARRAIPTQCPVARAYRFTAVSGGRPPARILLEASTESEWVARHLESLGHEVREAYSRCCSTSARMRSGLRRSARSGSKRWHNTPRCYRRAMTRRISKPLRIALILSSTVTSSQHPS